MVSEILDFDILHTIKSDSGFEVLYIYSKSVLINC